MVRYKAITTTSNRKIYHPQQTRCVVSTLYLIRRCKKKERRKLGTLVSFFACFIDYSISGRDIYFAHSLLLVCWWMKHTHNMGLTVVPVSKNRSKSEKFYACDTMPATFNIHSFLYSKFHFIFPMAHTHSKNFSLFTVLFWQWKENKKKKNFPFCWRAPYKKNK